MTALPTSPRIELRSNDRAFLVLDCVTSKAGVCKFSLWMHPALAAMWQWDGNAERPTITPSIDCRGGCGWHGHVINGEVQS